MHGARMLNSDTFGDPMVCSCSTGLATKLDLFIRLSSLPAQVVSIKILEIILALHITLKIKPLINRYSFWNRAAIWGFASPFLFLALPKKRSPQMSESLLQTFQYFFFSFFTLTLVASTVGNEAGNDLRKRLIPPSVSKNPCVDSFEPGGVSRPSPHPTSPLAYPATSKTAGTCALHQGSGDHWRASYMSGNREECPLISGLQRARGFQAGGWRFLLFG